MVLKEDPLKYKIIRQPYRITMARWDFTVTQKRILTKMISSLQKEISLVDKDVPLGQLEIFSDPGDSITLTIPLNDMVKESNTNPSGPHKKLFYDFWLVGETTQEKKDNFEKFIKNLDQRSNNDSLFIFDDKGKIEIVINVNRADSLAKTLAGFLKCCIEKKKVLSTEILIQNKRANINNRELVRDVFELSKLKGLEQLQPSKIKNLDLKYVNIYNKI